MYVFIFFYYLPFHDGQPLPSIGIEIEIEIEIQAI